MPSYINRLPALLTRLPGDGLHSIVRPTRDPSTLYLITRTALKFRPAGAPYSFAPSPSASGSSATGGQADDRQVRPRVKPGQRPPKPKAAQKGPKPTLEDLASRPLMAGGRIWAMRFDETGAWQKPIRLSQLPSQQIPSALRLKHAWEHVPASSLPSAVSERLASWRDLEGQYLRSRENHLRQRAAKAKTAKYEGRLKWAEGLRRKTLTNEELLRPTIVYKDVVVRAGEEEAREDYALAQQVQALQLGQGETQGQEQATAQSAA